MSSMLKCLSQIPSLEEGIIVNRSGTNISSGVRDKLMPLVNLFVEVDESKIQKAWTQCVCARASVKNNVREDRKSVEAKC